MVSLTNGSGGQYQGAPFNVVSCWYDGLAEADFNVYRFLRKSLVF